MLKFPLNITPLCLSLPLLKKQPKKKTINNIIWERSET